MEVSRRGGRNGYDSLPPETFMAARPLARGMPMDAPPGTNDYGPEAMARPPALQGDAEIIALAIDCLRAVGVRDVQVRIGHIGLLRTYLRLAPEDQGKVLHSLDKRDFPALRRELKRLDLQDIEDPLRQFVEL